MHASRYFFALWPNPVVARQLQQIQARLPAGRLTHGADLHLTLAFLGEVSEADEVKLHHLLQAIPFTAFELVLDQVDAFRRIGLSWAGPSQIPLALQTLYDIFGAALDDQGIWWDKRLVFRPHVTLARKVVVPQQRLAPPVVWWADQMVLARSGGAGPGGPRYTILAQRYANGVVRLV
ncbi:MAG: RNA 2',3'-cyclic phosphodiesterase [Alcaligenaceae bacterium]|jgi:RNA 2',3'-cyclic 3'-phosphodiesterase|nr:RNA 2',3'-cyclic phosphodiesterase [Alcaligenaceae bacterium]